MPGHEEAGAPRAASSCSPQRQPHGQPHDLRCCYGIRCKEPVEPDVEANGDALPEKPSRPAPNVQRGNVSIPGPGSGFPSDRSANVHLRVRGRYSVPSAQVTPAFVRAEVERQLRRDRRHGHRRKDGTRGCGRRARLRARRRCGRCGAPTRTHQIRAETKACNADPECVDVSPCSKTEGALRNAYFGCYGRVEGRAARRTRHRAPEVDDVWTGSGHLC